MTTTAPPPRDGLPLPPPGGAAPLPPAPGGTGTPPPLRRPVRDGDAAGGPAPVVRPRWEAPALIGLLAATAVLYLWGLGASGWANSFYSAAVQAGTQSWKALFYGTSDAAASITVDKPPLSLWVMGLSARIFGVNSWSILVPQALEGVAAVGLLYAAVRRYAGAAAGLIAGAALALTPVAVLMFRFNNPDALLTLLLVAGAYAVLRALEGASTRWLLLAGTLVGLGFFTKMLQALLVVPAFALVYLVCAPTPVGRRIRQLLAAGAALVVAGGWWVAIVELVPASMRPYIGGSQSNSALELILGYNGFGRLTGNETGSVGGGAGGGWGQTGVTRLFGAEIGGQVAWLLPAALLLAAAGLWARRGTPRTDLPRAAIALWLGWLLVTGLTFSLMAGIFHAYYTVALAPAIAALVAVGARLVWQRRHELAPAVVLSATLAITAAWSYILLGRSGSWQSWLAPTVLIGGLVVAVALLAVAAMSARLAAALGIAGVVVALAGPAAYAVQTAFTAHTGAIPSAGPTVAGAGFGPGGGRAGGGPGGGFGGPPGQQNQQNQQNGQSQQNQQGQVGPGAMGGAGGRGGAGGMGGLLDGASVSSAMVTTLSTDATGYTWVAATVGANNAASYQLATGYPVMPIGGFNGTDPSPTLAQFRQYVADGKIHYFITTGSMGQANGGSAAASAITSWVEQNFASTSVGGVTVYDLTATS